MKHILFSVIIPISLILIAASCNNNEPNPSNKPVVREMRAAESALLISSNEFCFDYFKILSKNQTSQNVLFSPYSAHAALSMLIHGASGETKQEIKNVLRISTQSDDDVKSSFKSLKEYLLQVDKSVTLNIENSIWTKGGLTINPTFASTMKEYYQSEITSLDFANPSAPKTINDWVNKQTSGRIPTIVEKLSSDDVMLLINAVYFKSDWKTKFNAALTEKASFVKDDASVIQVDLMSSSKMEAWHYYDNDIQLLDIPFGNGGYYFSVIMPQGTQTLDDFITNFTNDKLQSILSLEPKTTDDIQTIQLKMPKFKFDYEHNMVANLQLMGMNRAFTDLAELSNLFVDPMNLMVSDVKQKAFIQIDEKGGEAAAVTSITVGVTSAGPDFFTVDRPFLFLIREKNSNSILFIGKVHEPKF
ncbi:MAG: serpin family protein [Bacteroidales bacterium]|nr:serpin family protein [Bacteroidales bacterium]